MDCAVAVTQFVQAHEELHAADKARAELDARINVARQRMSEAKDVLSASVNQEKKQKLFNVESSGRFILVQYVGGSTKPVVMVTILEPEGTA